MKTNRLLLNLLFCLTLLGVSSAGVAAPAANHWLQVPKGFEYSDAHLDAQGDGYVLWKDTKGQRSNLQRFEDFTKAGEWSFEQYLAKGFHWNGGNRILLQAIAPGNDDLRLYELRGHDLELVWDSASLSEAMQLSPDHLSVSDDFRWWYGSRFLNDRIEIFAGALQDPNFGNRWIVDEPAPDAFLASLIEVTDAGSEEGPLTLALTVNGKAWLLSAGTPQPALLTLPSECSRVLSLEDGRDGLWAHCGRRIHLLYTNFSAQPESQSIEPSSVVRASQLRVLPNGTAVTIERRHGREGTLTELGRDAAGEVRASGPPHSYPLPLGVAGHIAGDQLLLPMPPRAQAPEAFRVVALLRRGPSGS